MNCFRELLRCELAMHRWQPVRRDQNRMNRIFRMREACGQFQRFMLGFTQHCTERLNQCWIIMNTTDIVKRKIPENTAFTRWRIVSTGNKIRLRLRKIGGRTPRCLREIFPQPNLFLNLSTLIVRIAVPNTSSAAACGHNTSSPTPLRNIPLTITKKYRSGIP